MTGQPQHQDEEIKYVETPVEGDEAQPEGGEGEGQEETPEEKARRMGWKPKDEFKGPTEQWVDAETFVNETEASVPRMRQANHSLERELKKMSRDMEAIKNHQERQVAAAERAGYERAMRDLENQLRVQVENGDVEAASKTNKTMREMEKRHAVSEVAARPAGEPDAEARRVVNGWKAKNKWFDENPAMNAAASAYEGGLAAQGYDLEERLEMTERYIKEQFPHKFARQRDPAPHPVAGRNRNNTQKAKPKPGTYEALAPSYRQECDRWVRASGKNEQAARAEWVRFATPDMFE